MTGAEPGPRNTPEGAPPPRAGSAPLDDRAADLIDAEQLRYMVSGPGGLRARPPADIAYRLRAFHGLQVTAGQVAAHLNGPAGRPLLAGAATRSQRAVGSPAGRPLFGQPPRVGTGPAMNAEDPDMSVVPQQIVALWSSGADADEIARRCHLTPDEVMAVIRDIVLGTLEVAPTIKVSPALARHLRQHLHP
jgi:hypothetical protein